jgi:hypothetical protein
VRGPYLVEVRSGVWGYSFDDLHVLNETLAGDVDLGLVGTFLPSCVDNGVDQAVSPDGVETRRLGVHSGNLTTCNKAIGRCVLSGSQRSREREKESSLVLETCGFEQFPG